MRPSAVTVGQAGIERLRRGEIAGDQVAPLYVQRTEAEIRYEQSGGVSPVARRQARVATKTAARAARRPGRQGRRVDSAIQIIPATLADLPDLLRLEEACFSAPWTRKMLEAELTVNQFAYFLVARETAKTATTDGAIVGSLCFWIVFEEVRLMNLAVAKEMRRRGIGAALVDSALHTGITQAATRAVLEVRASNHAALALYRRFGFTQVSVRPPSAPTVQQPP